MNIALIRDPDSTNGASWQKWLEDAGHRVSTIETFNKGQLDPISSDFDAVIPLITVNDYAHDLAGRLKAATLLEHRGAAMVNSIASIKLSSDKSLSYEVWLRHRILQPETHELSSLENWPTKSKPMILKPALGHSGNDIHLIDSLEQAHKIAQGWDNPALLQEYIESPRSIRIIATTNKVLACYERVAPGEIAANISRGATRKSFSPPQEVQKLAVQMVNSLGGGLMGVDILDKDGALYALEANVPFGFDANDPTIKSGCINFVEKLCTLGAPRGTSA